LAHLRLKLDLGSTKRLSHGLSQKVKSPSIQIITYLAANENYETKADNSHDIKQIYTHTLY